MNAARGVVVQTQVVHALILRETRTRFGTKQLGFLWAFVEPVLFVGLFYLLYSFTERSAPSGMTMFGFLTTGVVPYLGFRDTSQRVSVAVNSNRGLLFFPQVRPLDLVSARIVLESATFFLVFLLLMSAEALATGRGEVQNPLAILYGLGIACLLGGAFGTALGALTQYMPSLQNLTSALLRPLFWLSGIFFAANDVPLHWLEYLKYNPVLHCVELVRSGYYYSYDSRVADPLFPASCLVITALFALLFERSSRVRIQLS